MNQSPGSRHEYMQPFQEYEHVAPAPSPNDPMSELLAVDQKLHEAKENGQVREIVERFNELLTRPEELPQEVLEKIASGGLSIGRIESPRRSGWLWGRPQSTVYFVRSTDGINQKLGTFAVTINRPAKKGKQEGQEGEHVVVATHPAIQQTLQRPGNIRLSRDQKMLAVTPNVAQDTLSEMKAQAYERTREAKRRKTTFLACWQPVYDKMTRAIDGQKDVDPARVTQGRNHLEAVRKRLMEMAFNKPAPVTYHEIFDALSQQGLVAEHKTSFKVGEGLTKTARISVVCIENRSIFVYGETIEKGYSTERLISGLEQGLSWGERTMRTAQEVAEWMAVHGLIANDRPEANIYAAARKLHASNPTISAQLFPRALHNFKSLYEELGQQRQNTGGRNTYTHRTQHEKVRPTALPPDVVKALGTLGLKAMPTLNELHKTFRELAKKYHPDRNHDEQAGQIMADINEANELIERILNGR